MSAPGADQPMLGSLARMRRMWTLWRNERDDPEPFYSMLGRQVAADLDHRYGALRGQTILDLGCGPGFYTRELRRFDADVIPLDNSQEELELHGEPPAGAIIGDAMNLPFEGGSIDGVFTSNMIEHTPRPTAVFDEIERVLRPGGWAYVSWTNWYSPWGGHDISPYHYLGPSLGLRVYERVHGPPRKNRPGEGLFPLHIGPTLRDLQARSGIVVDEVQSRYWPKLGFVTRIPVLREVATWNCAIYLRKRV